MRKSGESYHMVIASSQNSFSLASYSYLSIYYFDDKKLSLTSIVSLNLSIIVQPLENANEAFNHYNDKLFLGVLVAYEKPAFIDNR